MLQVASMEVTDRGTPNGEMCMAYGFSAIAIDQRTFVTHNPFSLYVKSSHQARLRSEAQ